MTVMIYSKRIEHALASNEWETENRLPLCASRTWKVCCQLYCCLLDRPLSSFCRSISIVKNVQIIHLQKLKILDEYVFRELLSFVTVQKNWNSVGLRMALADPVWKINILKIREGKRAS